MTVEFVDGIKVIKLHDCQPQDVAAQDLAMLRIWQLLTGGHEMRDTTGYCHRF